MRSVLIGLDDDLSLSRQNGDVGEGALGQLGVRLFDTNAISTTAAEAPYVLDGLLGNAANFVSAEHFTDTGGLGY